MSKRRSEPDEALGPAVDGLEEFKALPPRPMPEEPPADEPEEEPAAQEAAIEEPVALLCGFGSLAETVGKLAAECGFAVEIATRDESGMEAATFCRKVWHVPDWRDFVEVCGVNRNYFICIFLENDGESEDILMQCMPSDAFYLGVFGDQNRRDELYASLRENGVPDAELAAVACPMGLNIGAVTDSQRAVGIVAEIMAAKAGTLKRLRYGDYRPRK